ncbi:hypothetical protein [Kitasatospora phosalacinea]|uniref:Uncharacterized protein n=1 Tax=Kitasatospora phosalacinea TaxID=2065 RepID=A0A9W6PIC3_9ACTN|nr:hypothetical protein [Kitasatospora phosalacinea]GLW55372.1 hypothetical protein Kpho01_33830 [Kitasatospora phosalacinea]
MTEASRRAWEAAVRLVELLGVEVGLSEGEEGVQILLELPMEGGHDPCVEVLAVLGGADRYGHRRRSGREHLWAVFR